MTPDQIDNYVNSPAGRAYQAVYAIENVLDELNALPIEVLRVYETEIAAAAIAFNCLANSIIARKVA